MDRKSIVTYKGARAYYDIRKDEKIFIATLEKYTGDSSQMPPRSVIFIKENAGHLGAAGFISGQLQAADGFGTSSLLDDIFSALDKS